MLPNRVRSSDELVPGTPRFSTSTDGRRRIGAEEVLEKRRVGRIARQGDAEGVRVADADDPTRRPDGDRRVTAQRAAVVGRAGLQQALEQHEREREAEDDQPQAPAHGSNAVRRLGHVFKCGPRVSGTRRECKRRGTNHGLHGPAISNSGEIR